MSENQKSNADQPAPSSLNRFDYEKACKSVVRLLKTDEGRTAIREGLLRTAEGKEIIRSEFGVAIVDKSQKDEKPIVAVLIPTHKKPENETGNALERMIPEARKDCHVIMRPSIASSVVHWVRNQLLSQLYQAKTPFDYVLFMDDDMVPQPNAVNVLLGRKVDVVGAVCTVRQDPALPNVRYFSPSCFIFQTADIDRPGMWEVGAVGTGFMLISKKALDAVGEYTLSQQFQRKYMGMSKEVADEREKHERARFARDGNAFWFEFLKHPLGDGEYGEDISFCFKARECGFTIYADSTVKVGHIGNYGFSIEDYWAYREEAVQKGLVISLSKPEEKQPEPVAVESDEKISILVPTRGRPENMKRLVASVKETANDMPHVIFYIDDDDQPSRDCADAMVNAGEKVGYVLGPRICLSETWNKCAAAATGDILMHGGDDIVFKTKGWDALVKAAFSACPDRILFVHGDDGYWGSKFGTHGFIHRKWMEAVGYFVPPYFSSDFNDTWLNEVSNMIGRRRFLPFITDHLHPIFGKAPWDQTHKERLARHEKDKVNELYAQKEPERKADAEKLRAVMQPELVTA